MADSNIKTVLKVCATKANRLPDLAIKEGQLIFIQDKHRIAFDFKGQRVFYNQIEELSTERERITLEAPVNGFYYFVIEKAVLWTYQDKWIQITTAPDEIVFIGTEMPELGSEKTLYVDKENKEISVWDNATNDYIIVADKNDVVSEFEIDSLFA